MNAKKRHSKERTVRAPKDPGAPPLFGSRATLISVLLLVAAGLIFFWRVLFLGEILTGGDVLAAAAIFDDYAAEQMAGGHLPLWNPYIFSGMPFFDSMSWSAFVYPSYWLTFALEKIPGVDLPRLFFLFLHYELAALGTFFYLRSRKVGHGGAVIAGIAFMLSPHMIGLATIGHVRRLPHPTDRRKILVELTDEGRSFATDRLPKHYRSMVGIAAHLTDRERASLARLYEKALAGFRTVLDGEGV